jgi:hypothetical protein
MGHDTAKPVRMRRHAFELCVITLIVLQIVGMLTSDLFPVESLKKSIAGMSGYDVADIQIREFDLETGMIGARVAARAECGTGAARKSVLIRAAKLAYFLRWEIVECDSELVASIDPTR